MDIKLASGKIRKFFYAHNRMPTHREICEMFGYATKASSQFLVKKLVRAGMIDKDETGHLIPRQLFQLPILGSIRAGYPTAAEEQLLDMMSIGRYLVTKPEKSYILKVTGDSMVNAGIKPGDFVIIEKDREAKKGDIVVAQIDEEFTLKYLEKINGETVLAPANEKYPVMKPSQNLTVFGVVVSVIRKYN